MQQRSCIQRGRRFQGSLLFLSSALLAEHLKKVVLTGSLRRLAARRLVKVGDYRVLGVKAVDPTVLVDAVPGLEAALHVLAVHGVHIDRHVPLNNTLLVLLVVQPVVIVGGVEVVSVVRVDPGGVDKLVAPLVFQGSLCAPASSLNRRR